jgi:hypothetical protein
VVQAWNLRILVLVLVFSEQSIGMFPARHIVAPKIEKQGLTKALEEKIPALAQEHGAKLNAILKGNFEESRITSPRSFAKRLLAPFCGWPLFSSRLKDTERTLSSTMFARYLQA